MDHIDPVFAQRLQTQMDDPHVRQTSRDHQRAEPFGIGQMALVQIKSATFLIREEGLDLVPFVMPVNDSSGSSKLITRNSGSA